MTHLLNCHGGWTFIALVLTQLPLIGLTFAKMLSHLSEKKVSGNEGEDSNAQWITAWSMTRRS